MSDDLTGEHSAVNLARSCGQCQMLPEEAACVLEMTADAFGASALFEAYYRARLEAQLAVRRALVMKAADGDGAAQKEFLRLAAKPMPAVEF